MKNVKKVMWSLAAAITMFASTGMTSLAAGWVQNETGWWYDNGDGTWMASSWQWLDGNQDGVAECYYFDENGYCLLNTVTPDGYTVNADGAWTENGVVQTRAEGPGVAAQNNQTAESTQPAEGVQMRILVDGQELTATLEDNATARAITEQLPMTLPMMDLYGREMCYRFDEAFPANEARTTSFEVGDIIYWPPRHSFVILYHQDGERFEMQKVGHINADAATVERIFGNGDVNMTFELIP